MLMRSVRDILKRKKGHEVVSMAPDDTVFAMLELMAELNIGAVLVLDGTELVGVVSERDYARGVVLKGRASKDVLLREIMSTDTLTVTPSCRMQTCMELMTEHRIRHLPVVEHDRVIGVVSIGDVVNELITEQQSLITDLENYIAPGH